MLKFGFCAGNCLSCSASLEPWLNSHGLLFLAKGSCFGTDIMFCEIHFLDLTILLAYYTHTHTRKGCSSNNWLIIFPFVCFNWLFIDSDDLLCTGYTRNVWDLALD